MCLAAERLCRTPVTQSGGATHLDVTVFSHSPMFEIPKDHQSAPFHYTLMKEKPSTQHSAGCEEIDNQIDQTDLETCYAS
jgi:hypothetical protein